MVEAGWKRIRGLRESANPGRPYRVHPYRLNVGGELAAVERLRRADRLPGPRRSTPSPTLPREPRPDEPRHTFRALDKAQSHRVVRVVGYLGTSFEDPARDSLDVLSSVLSGQGGRLFIELRDKRSMAYSAGSASRRSREAGVKRARGGGWFEGTR